MPIKLMYITNRPDIAQIAEISGVDRIFLDMEYIGKAKRQGGMDTVQSHHSFEDIVGIRKAVNQAEILVRCNPIHQGIKNFPDSKEEIARIITCGADIVMLPYFKTIKEVETFIEYIDGKAKVMLLVETVEAVKQIEDILNINGIDELFIGLNDLSLGYKKKFMFELLTDGTVEQLCTKFREKEIPYGFGGIAALGQGMLPAEKIIKEHYRMGSTCAILSRSFCNIDKIKHMGIISTTFINGVKEIREFEKEVQKYSDYFMENEIEVKRVVKEIVG
ncbi:MAG: aldolase/citrate lyase family protein [Lachnospiraceae bacterium]